MYVKLTSIIIANDHETIRPSAILSSSKPGTMVQVRPCDEQYGDKTYLGMYLCAAPTGFCGRQIGETLILEMTEYTNPAIYIPELDKIVWGYGSWWGEIKSEDELCQITDEDIQDVWYVRALKQLSERQKEQS